MMFLRATVALFVLFFGFTSSVFAYGGGGGGDGGDSTTMVSTTPPASSTPPTGFIPIPLDSLPEDTVFVDPESGSESSAPRTVIIVVSQDELGGDLIDSVIDLQEAADEALRNPAVQTVIIISGGIAVGIYTGGAGLPVYGQAIAAGGYAAATSYATSGGDISSTAYGGVKDTAVGFTPVDPVTQAAISVYVDMKVAEMQGYLAQAKPYVDMKIAETKRQVAQAKRTVAFIKAAHKVGSLVHSFSQSASSSSTAKE